MLNTGTASNTVELESSCGRRNVWCSGEMLRDHTEHRLRRQLTKLMFLFGHRYSAKVVKENMNRSLSGEITLTLHN